MADYLPSPKREPKRELHTPIGPRIGYFIRNTGNSIEVLIPLSANVLLN